VAGHETVGANLHLTALDIQILFSLLINIILFMSDVVSKIIYK